MDPNLLSFFVLAELIIAWTVTDKYKIRKEQRHTYKIYRLRTDGA